MSTLLSKIKENLEILLDEGKARQVYSGVEKFKGDAWAVAVVNEKLNAVISQQGKPTEHITSLINVVESILVLDYGKMDPLFLSQMYRAAAENGQFEKYKKSVEHLTKINAAAPVLITAGIEKTADYDTKPTRTEGYNTVYCHPFTVKKESYMQIPLTVITSQNLLPENIFPNLEEHFASLDNKGIDINKLMQKGYQSILHQVFTLYAAEPQTFKSALTNTSKILGSLKEKGMRVYHDNTINMLRDYTAAKQLTPLANLVDYASKNFMILNLKLYLDGKEDEENKS